VSDQEAKKCVIGLTAIRKAQRSQAQPRRAGRVPRQSQGFTRMKLGFVGKIVSRNTLAFHAQIDDLRLGFFILGDDSKNKTSLGGRNR